MENAQIETFEIEPVDTASTRWDRWVRRFDNFVVAKGITNDTRIKAMMLHHAGETVFELSESVGVLDTDTYAVAREKLTAYFSPRRNTEYKIFVFRQTQQLPGGGETLDQFHARLLQLSKNCNFANRDGEIRSQIIQKCAMAKIRDKGLSEADITLEQLLRYGRTLESTIQQSLVMSNSAHAMSTTAPSVNAVSSRQQQHYGKTNKGASRDSGNQRRHDDRQGQHHPRHSRGRGGQRTSMNTRKRAPPRHANTVPGHSDARFCPGCGKSPHNRTECSAWGEICFKCDKRNHFANVCRSTTENTNLVANVEQQLSRTDADLSVLSLYNTNTQHRDMVKPYECTIKVSSMPVTMEIDTGCSVSLLSHTEWARIKEKAPKLTLDTQNVPCLRTYSGHNIQPLGRTLLDVYHNDTHYQLYALVVPGTGPNLLGRDWLSVLQLNWAKLYVDETVQPRYCKPRPVPLAMRAKVESELYRPQEEGVIRPVAFSEWAAPIVPVLKASGDIRICGDYKVTINQAVKVDKYPIPNIDDLFTKVSGGQLFTTLDLSNAYQQVVLEEESRKLTTINTTKGLFEYVRLPYGVSSAPGIYQRIMEQLLQNIPMTVVYLDDILVSGSTPEEHDRNLRTVLTRLLDKGLRLRKEKCVFRQKSCRYLGHVIDVEGIHPTDDKVTAIKNAPVPQNVQQLRSYLGLIHYYHNFLSNISSLLAPLHELTRLDTEWKWGTIHQKAFAQSKALLSSSKVLAHYDPQLPIIVSSDASAYGIGSVLSHRMPDGSEKPVAFASRSLSPAEKKYAQLEKEALALIFGVTKFHKYLCGRSFTLQSDHRPLLGLLKQDRVISAMASARMKDGR